MKVSKNGFKLCIGSQPIEDAILIEIWLVLKNQWFLFRLLEVLDKVESGSFVIMPFLFNLLNGKNKKEIKVQFIKKLIKNKTLLCLVYYTVFYVKIKPEKYFAYHFENIRFNFFNSGQRFHFQAFPWPVYKIRWSISSLQLKPQPS